MCQLRKVLSLLAIESPYINSKKTTGKTNVFFEMYSFDILKVTDPKSSPWGLKMLLYSAI